LPAFELNREDRVVAGVCAGIAKRLDADANVVRLLFAVLALAGGAGILLYFALWAYALQRRFILVAVLAAFALAALLRTLGLSTPAVLGATLVFAGLAMVLRRGGSVRAGGSLPFRAAAVIVIGAVILLSHTGSTRPFIGPGAAVGMLLLVVGPWVWRLQEERGEKIRLEERAAVATRVHDSVLQTLALVQRHADDPARVRALSRRQERELRRWLYGSGVAESATLADALADAAADVEELHGINVELASAGDVPLDERVEQIVLAAREAMTNAAKYAGVNEVSVYAEVTASEIEVFVRDRGAGFDRGAVPGDRRGIAESIEARMARAGGSAAVTSAVGSGTEVELRLPR
jgi:signal transduction histidine kinase